MATAIPAGALAKKTLFLLLLVISLVVGNAAASTTELHIVKYASDRSTVLAEKTVTYQWMEANLPVMGDGVTHYYHQGPVFVDDADTTKEEALRWNPLEDTNILDKDMGAVKGTDIRELCNLVGGMSSTDTLVLRASDGMSRELAYANVYSPSSRQGPAVITWYCTGIGSCPGAYPDSGYSDGMRLVFFADNSVNPWGYHVFGNYDWHESADQKDWYYYMSDGEKYPTTTGLSVKSVSEIQIYSTLSAAASASAAGGSSGGGAGLPVAGAPLPANPALYGYKGKALNTFREGTLNGSIRLFSDPASQPVPANSRIREMNLSVDLPAGSNITLARMYLYLSDSYHLQSRRGVVPSFYTTLDTTMLDQDQLYIDTNGDDNGYVAATVVYDVREMLDRSGTYKVSVKNKDYEQSVFTIEGLLLVAAFENGTAPATRYWINEGCDVVATLPEKGLLPEDCETAVPFPGVVNMSTSGNTTLYLVSTGLDRDNTTEHTVRFNNGIWTNLFDTQNNSLVMDLQAGAFLNETFNTGAVQSTIRAQNADYLVNRNAILVVEQGGSRSSRGEEKTGTSRIVQRAPPESPGDRTQMAGSGSCQVTLDSDPAGALIYVDGRYLGKTTPCTIDLETGDYHTVRLELEGYMPSETSFLASNSTSIRTSLYSPVHTTKGRLQDVPKDPDGIRYGGLYISSRPNGALISIDGVSTGRTTPSLFMGMEPGSHTIKLVRELRDQNTKGSAEFVFEEQSALVTAGVLGLVDINGIGYTRLFDVILDSRTSRGVPITLNGYPLNATLPTKISTPKSGSFVTLHENNAYISYSLPILTEDDRYLLLEPRTFQNLSIAVDSDPPGAEIFIDGFRTGFTTPYAFDNISDGTHRVMVTKNNYVPQQSLIELHRYSVPISTTPVYFILNEYPSGFLYVGSTPEGGKIFIDGLYTGEITPALFRSIPVGAHTVKVTGVNSSRTFHDVTITSLAMTNLTADFSVVTEPQFSSYFYHNRSIT